MASEIDEDILKLVPSHNPDFEFEEEYLVNIINPQETLFINGTAAMIWALCDGTTSVAGIVDELGQCFPEERQAVAADSVGAMMLLAERGAIFFK